ncbi:MAG: hypothetical protein ACOXZ9_09940 [Bacteroidales bacterium]|jgi:hypothetical protein
MFKKFILISISVFISIFVYGQSLNDIRINIICDSVVKSDEFLTYSVKIENKSKRAKRIYLDYLSLQISNGKDKAINNCMINEKGEELFFSILRKDRNIKIKRDSCYIQHRDIDFKKLCWNDYSVKTNEYFIRIEYYDLKSGSFYYSPYKKIVKIID